VCCDAGFPRDWNLGWCGYLDTNTTAAGRAKNIFSRKPWRCSLLRNAKLPDSGARGGSPFRIQQLIGNAIAHDLFHLTTVRNMFLGDDEMSGRVFHVWCLIRRGGWSSPISWTDRQLIPKDLKALWHITAEHAFCVSYLGTHSV
jgi:hypothetical protein